MEIQIENLENPWSSSRLLPESLNTRLFLHLHPPNQFDKLNIWDLKSCKFSQKSMIYGEPTKTTPIALNFNSSLKGRKILFICKFLLIDFALFKCASAVFKPSKYYEFYDYVVIIFLIIYNKYYCNFLSEKPDSTTILFIFR